MSLCLEEHLNHVSWFLTSTYLQRVEPKDGHCQLHLLVALPQANVQATVHVRLRQGVWWTHPNPCPLAKVWHNNSKCCLEIMWRSTGQPMHSFSREGKRQHWHDICCNTSWQTVSSSLSALVSLEKIANTSTRASSLNTILSQPPQQMAMLRPCARSLRTRYDNTHIS